MGAGVSVTGAGWRPMERERVRMVAAMVSNVPLSCRWVRSLPLSCSAKRRRDDGAAVLARVKGGGVTSPLTVGEGPGSDGDGATGSGGEGV